MCYCVFIAYDIVTVCGNTGTWRHGVSVSGGVECEFAGCHDNFSMVMHFWSLGTQMLMAQTPSLRDKTDDDSSIHDVLRIPGYIP